MPNPDDAANLDFRISQAVGFDLAKTQPLPPEPAAIPDESPTQDKIAEELKAALTPDADPETKNQILETSTTRTPTLPIFPQYGHKEAPSSAEITTRGQLLQEIIRQYGDIFSPRFAEAEIPEDDLNQEKTTLINQLSEMAKKYPSIRQMITIAGEINFGGSSQETPLSARAVAGFALILDLVGADQFTALCLETRADLTDRRADLDEKLGKFAQWCSSNNVPFEPTPDLISSLLDNSLRQLTLIPLHQAARDLLGIPQNYNAQLFVESDPANPISALRVSLETKWQPPRPTQIAAETTIKVLGTLKNAINRFRPPSPPPTPSPA